MRLGRAAPAVDLMTGLAVAGHGEPGLRRDVGCWPRTPQRRRGGARRFERDRGQLAVAVRRVRVPAGRTDGTAMVRHLSDDAPYRPGPAGCGQRERRRCLSCLLTAGRRMGWRPALTDTVRAFSGKTAWLGQRPRGEAERARKSRRSPRWVGDPQTCGKNERAHASGSRSGCARRPPARDLQRAPRRCWTSTGSAYNNNAAESGCWGSHRTSGSNSDRPPIRWPRPAQPADRTRP